MKVKFERIGENRMMMVRNKRRGPRFKIMRSEYSNPACNCCFFYDNPACLNIKPDLCGKLGLGGTNYFSYEG